MRKPTIWVPTRSDTNQTTRVVKTKALISFAVTAKLICTFVFACADCWFSYAAAQFFAKPQMSQITKKKQQSLGFPTRSDTNSPVQLQKNGRILKFWIKEEEGLMYYWCSENKGTESCADLEIFS